MPAVFSAETKGAWTNLVEGAGFAFGFSCEADLPSMENQQVSEPHPLLFGRDFHEVLLDFCRILVLG